MWRAAARCIFLSSFNGQPELTFKTAPAVCQNPNGLAGNLQR